MTVEDIYRITNSSQVVHIYNPNTKVFVFNGVCSDIPLSCFDFQISQIFTNDNMLAIMVK